jgi:hypothetical protein
LAIGELPGVELDQLDGPVQPDATGKVVEDLAISEGLGRRPAQGLRPGEQLPHLVDQARGEHFLHAAIDPPGQLLARPVEHEHPTGLGRQPGVELLLQRADRLAGLEEDLQGPDEPPGVVGVKPPGGPRIDLGEAAVEVARAVRSGFFLELPAELPVGGRARKDPPQQPFEIQGRPADEEHPAATPPDPVDARLGRLQVLRQAVLLVGLQHVDQVVRHDLPLPGRGLGRAHVHPPVQGHRVHGDDFRPDFRGQRHAHGGLAARRGARQVPAVGRAGGRHDQRESARRTMEGEGSPRVHREHGGKHRDKSASKAATSSLRYTGP